MIFVKSRVLVKVEAIHSLSEWEVVNLLNGWKLWGEIMIDISIKMIIVCSKIRVLGYRWTLHIWSLVILETLMTQIQSLIQRCALQILILFKLSMLLLWLFIELKMLILIPRE